MPNSQRFSWLHLTDVHVGLTAHSYLWPDVEASVHEDLARLHDKCGPWNAIFFTGDLTQQGEKSEFQRFDESLKRLLEKLQTFGTTDPIFLAVPGNHDLTRPDPFSGMVSLSRTWADEPNLRNHLFSKVKGDWVKGDLRIGIESAFGNWEEWWASRSPRSLPDYRRGAIPGDFRATLEADGLRIGVVGLNSAFLHLRSGNLKGKLGLDHRQLAELMPEGAPDWWRAHDAAFLLTHHSQEWLDAPGQSALRNDIALPGRFVLHLFGHEHEGGSVLTVEGGAQPRYRVMGHSLFGLPEWGEENHRQGRLFGYSAGELRVNDGNRFVRLWPRKGVPLQAGGWQIAPDYSNSLKEDQGTEPVAMGTSPRPPNPSSTPPVALARSAGVNSVVVTSASPLAGWELLDLAFRSTRRQDLKPEALRRFFDGEVPAWAHALSPGIPRRKIVQKLVTELQRSVASEVWQVSLLIGAGGEGKSTALRQAAVDVANGLIGWKILWRSESDSLLDAEAVRGLPPGPWLLVSDDADQLVRSFSKTLSALRRAERNDIHFLLATRDTDWVHAGGEAIPWGEVLKRHRMAGIDEAQDARDVVRAWAAIGPDALGALHAIHEEPDRVHALMEAAKRGTGRYSQGSFFGAILKVRFSPEGLRAHVLTLMNRLRERRLASGKTLLDAFLVVAALDAVGIEGMDRKVLADLLQIRAEQLRTDVLRPLGEEAAVVQAGALVRTRHVDIARAALVVAEHAVDQDLAELYAQIVRQTILSANVQAVSSHGQVLNIGPTLLKELPTDFDTGRREEIAIRAAKATVKAQPDRLAGVTTLARTWRAAHDPGEAIQALQDAVSHFGEMVDYDEMIRGFWFEWSVCAGELNRQAAAALLAGLSISDEFSRARIELDRAKISLAGLGVSFGELAKATGRDVYARGLRAVAVLGMLTQPDPKTSEYFKRHSRKADEFNVGTPDLSKVILWLQEAVEAALKQAQAGGELKFKGTNAPTFGMLEHLLAKQLPRSTQQELKPSRGPAKQSSRNGRKPKR